MDSILRYLVNREYEMSRDFAISFLSDLLIQRSLGLDSAVIEQRRKEALMIKYFSMSEEGEVLSSDEDTSSPIARISMNGVMLENGGMSTPGVREISELFYDTYNRKSVKGILFEVASGGGEGSAGSLLNSTLQDRNKPVVVLTNLLGSAALKGTLPADEIIARTNSTQVGSIGSMAMINKELLDPEKNTTLDFYSSKSPNKNKEYRALQAGNIAPLIESLTVSDDLFMAEVRKFRPLKGSIKEVRHTLSGELFRAKESKKRGLIDGIGGFNYAIKRLNSHIKSFN